MMFMGVITPAGGEPTACRQLNIDWVDAEVPEYLVNALIGNIAKAVQSTLNPPKQAAAC